MVDAAFPFPYPHSFVFRFLTTTLIQSRCFMGDFFAFRRMLAPVLIHIFFWVGTLGCLALGGAILGGAVDPMKWAEHKHVPAEVAKEIHGVGPKLNLFLGICILILG